MSEMAKELPDIATIQPERLIKYRVSEDRFSAEVLLPGLWYTDFDKKIGGKWTLYSIVQTTEAVKWTELMHGYMFFPELTYNRSHFMFIASTTITFSKDAHFIRDNIWGFPSPFHFISGLSNVGNTSFTVSQDMFDYKSGRKIQSSVNKTVYVDAKTRKPTRLPDWFTSKAKQFLDLKRKERQSIDKTDPVNIPDNAFQYDIKALQSDCDFNLHVNQASFLKWCTDAGAMAVLNRKYKSFTEDIGMFAIETLSVQYKGEVLRDETVTVFTWEDDSEPRTLHFALKNYDSLVMIAKMKYYENEPVVAMETMIPKL